MRLLEHTDPGKHKLGGRGREPDRRVLLLNEVVSAHTREYLAVAARILRGAGLGWAPDGAREVFQNACLSALKAFRENSERHKPFPHDGADPRVEFRGYVKFAALRWLRANRLWLRIAGQEREWEEVLADAELAESAHDVGTNMDFLSWWSQLGTEDREIVSGGAGIYINERTRQIEICRRGTSAEIARRLERKHGIHRSRDAVRKRKSRLVKEFRQWLEAPRHG